ncbi:MAG TPA: septal ring lytic transglycosylase RlpA family protein [Steroidobacteraceae bacterium]|nr:septal ring lytic transglycosylase RlpA family protein [Steroidobacteraceae bacterium]
MIRPHPARTLPLLAALLGACAHAPPRHAALPRAASAPTVLPPNVPDPNAIADAVPRAEPRSASGNPPFYDVAGHRYVVMASANGYVERGVASWYGTEFHGLRTSTGEPYDMFAMTAAHKTLPLPCYARVTNLANGRSVVVRINDRGPFVTNRIIDLSYTAAQKLDMIRNGTAFVQVEALTPGAPPLQAALPVSIPAASAANVGLSTVPAAPPLTATASATAAPHFYVQVGAFARPENAQRALQKLRAAGLDARVADGPGTSPALQRVRLGPIGSVQEFDALVARLAALGFPDARLAQE